jgi:hypothetical protein
MDYDGYSLYELLKDGEATTIAHKCSDYTLRFMGEPTGSDNYLAVTNQDGEEKRFGWGWSSEQVWRALAHLEAGWDSKQVLAYRPYNEKAEVEGGVTY